MRAHRLVSLSFVALAVASAGLAAWPGAPLPADAATRPARRIVAGSGALVEILYAIGAGDRVVGRSHFTTYPPEALALPDVGGAIDPNLEVLETLKPDCLLLQMKSASVEQFAADRRIRSEHFKIETIADLYVAIVRVGVLSEHAREAHVEVARLTKAIDALRVRAPATRRPKVLISSQRLPGELRGVGTLGAGTFIMECVEVAGGQNALPSVRGYAPVSKEAIVEAKPDVVIELRTEPASAEVRAALVRDWEVALPDVPAVRDKRIEVVDHEASLIPGPRLVEVIALLARAIGAPR